MPKPSGDNLRAFLDQFGLSSSGELTALGLFILGHAWIDRWLIHLLATNECIRQGKEQQINEADMDGVLDGLISKPAEGTFLRHLNHAKDQGLLPDVAAVCEEVNRARDHFLHWKPGRFSVPTYRGEVVTSAEGNRLCMRDIALVVRAFQTTEWTGEPR